MLTVATNRGLKRLITFLIAGAFVLFLAVFFLRLYYPFPFRENVQVQAQQYQLDPLLLVAVMRVESGFDPRAVSPKGARGLMQLMPETAEWVAQMMGMETFEAEMLFEPEINLSMGAWYLAELRRVFNGETVLALAAYNGGRGNVSRWLSEEAWSGKIEEVDNIPFPETRTYVKKVLTNYSIYRRIWGRSIYGELAL